MRRGVKRQSEENAIWRQRSEARFLASPERLCRLDQAGAEPSTPSVLRVAAEGLRSSALRSRHHLSLVRHGKTAVRPVRRQSSHKLLRRSAPGLDRSARMIEHEGQDTTRSVEGLSPDIGPCEPLRESVRSPKCPPPPRFASWVRHRRRRPARGFGSRRRRRVEPGPKGDAQITSNTHYVVQNDSEL